MKLLNEIFKYFAYITAGTALICFIAVLLHHGDTVSVWMLGEIPAVGLITAQITVPILHKECKTKKGLYLLLFLHFILLSAVMSALGVSFDWIGLSAKNILFMTLCTALVYAFTYSGIYLSSKKDADELNEVIKEKNQR